MDPNPPNAGSVAPAGTIQVGAIAYNASGRVGVFISVLSGNQYVAGASVQATCTGQGGTFTVAGTTADRSAWAPTTNPSIPSGPSAFFWSVQTSTIAAGAQIACHGTASYKGTTASF